MIFCAYAAMATTPVGLGTAGGYVILVQAGISTVPTSAIDGDIGVSPISFTYMTGFGLSMSPDGTFSTSTQVTGSCNASDYVDPTPSKMSTAIYDGDLAVTHIPALLHPRRNPDAHRIVLQSKRRGQHAPTTQPAMLQRTDGIRPSSRQYNDTAGRTADHSNIADISDGLIGGTTFSSGVYQWTTDVLISSDIAISGSATDLL